MLFIRTTAYEKDYKRLTRELTLKVYQRLELFSVNEFDPLLNNHKLKYEYEGFRSINLTGDWRIVFRKIDDKYILLHRIGTHHQLFGK